MNLLFISTTYPNPVNPRQGAFNQHLVKSLRDSHHVDVIAPVPWVQMVKSRNTWTANKTLPKFAGTSAGDSHPIYLYPPKLMRRYYDRFYWHSIQNCIAKASQRERPQLVLGYWLHPDGAAAIQAAKRLQVPCVLIAGGSDLNELPKNPARRKAIQSVLESVDRLIVVSDHLRRQAIALGIDPVKVHVVYRGVDKAVFKPIDRREARQSVGLDDQHIVVVWSGRLEPVKNPTMLLQAATRWHDHWGKRFKLLIAGEGSLRNELMREVARLGLKTSVQFEGMLTQTALATRFNAANLTVLTSHSEGVPNVLLESIACGLRFVATDVGGIPEIASGGIDRLVKDDDHEALAEAVIEILESDPVGERHFYPGGLSDMADRVNEVLKQLLSS
ncbi:glycosyltransferase [Stieleria sp. JC731]|uniref:glycosyltransferase n=1 Tax=Pirellulaceae TaxID=2691357 RepID=UPI001E50F172|nr:glycosyltransferase [Stieleria sp. JC731]MCC9599518.1 glycosyltransferase [Stieleria sp. JC731]